MDSACLGVTRKGIVRWEDIASTLAKVYEKNRRVMARLTWVSHIRSGRVGRPRAAVGVRAPRQEWKNKRMQEYNTGLYPTSTGVEVRWADTTVTVEQAADLLAYPEPPWGGIRVGHDPPFFLNIWYVR